MGCQHAKVISAEVGSAANQAASAKSSLFAGQKFLIHDEELWVPPNSAFTTTSRVSNYYLASFHLPALTVTLSSWQRLMLL
jgi:hypothetical protein